MSDEVWVLTPTGPQASTLLNNIVLNSRWCDHFFKHQIMISKTLKEGKGLLCVHDYIPRC